MECARNRITVNAIVPNALTRMISTIPGMAPLVEEAERTGEIPRPRARSRTSVMYR